MNKPQPLKNNHRYMRRIVDKEIKLIPCYDIDTIKSAIEYNKDLDQKVFKKILTLLSGIKEVPMEKILIELGIIQLNKNIAFEDIMIKRNKK